MKRSVRSTPRVVLLLTLLCGGPLIPSPTLSQAAGDERQERLQERDRLGAEARRLRAQGQLGAETGTQLESITRCVPVSSPAEWAGRTG
jgi:hypothetical protein